MEGTSSSYKSGWYIDSDNPYIVYKKPSQDISRGIKGRLASDYSFKATLKLFAVEANNADIDNGTAEALASQEFTFILKAEAAKPKVNFKPIDKDSLEAIENAKVTVEYNWSPLSPEADGSYVLDSTEVYTAKASADGYKNYSNMAYAPATEGGTVELPMEKIRTSRISFNIKDSNGDPVSGATVRVKQGYYGATVEPQSDGTYNLVNGESYSYTVSAANYSQVTGNITPTEDKTIDLAMTKNISRYKVIFEIKDEDGNSLTGAAVTVTDDEDDMVAPETDGTYESVSSFVETKKTDIRYVISYFGQSQFFEVLPLLVL